MKGNYNETYLRKRKMLLVLPVILIPMITLGFYGLGGGKGGKGGGVVSLNRGLNMSLPAARFDTKKKSLNKLGFYRQSEQDSLKLHEIQKMDPYSQLRDTMSHRFMLPLARVDTGFSSKSPAAGGITFEPSATDVQASGLLKKLEQLKGVLNRREQDVVPGGPFAGRRPDSPARIGSRVLPEPVVEPAGPFGRVGSGDPDLDKLNTLMDKVLRVRYPGDESHIDTTATIKDERPVPLQPAPREEVLTTLPEKESEEGIETGFINLDEEGKRDSAAVSLIAAVVDGAQTLVSGEFVSMRIAEETVIGGRKVPKGTVVSGKASLSEDRLLVSVRSIRMGNLILPVALDVVDMDGVTGFNVRGSIDRNVSKESADRAISSLGLSPTDASVSGQATAAGLQAARTLLSRKVRLVRVGLPAGYKVFLRNSKVNY